MKFLLLDYLQVLLNCNRCLSFLDYIWHARLDLNHITMMVGSESTTATKATRDTRAR